MFEAILETPVFLGLVVFFLFILFILTDQRRKLPPGPMGLPLIGNVLQLSNGDVLQKFVSFRERYGDIYTIKLGGYTTIVVNGYENLKEIFARRGHEFSDRPHIFIHDELSKQKGIVGSSGKRWKAQRAFAIRTLKNLGVGKKTLESKIKEEVDVFLDEISKKDGTPFNCTDLIQLCISNVICSIVFGRRFEHTDIRFLKLMQLFEAMLEHSGHTGLMTVFEFLKYIPGDLFKRKLVISNMEEITEFVGDLVVEHNKTYDENNIRDYIDAFLKEKKAHENDEESTFQDDQLIVSISELFFAGTETTATAVKWAIVYLLHNPDVQDRIHEELDRVVGDARDVCLADRPNLTYCEAVIWEVFRCSDMGPLSVQHSANRDTEINGFTIPKGTSLMPNLNSVHHDPILFPNPRKFDPSRFIDEEGKLHGYDKVIPFCIGKRVCLGASLARSEIFLFLFSMLQRYTCLPSSNNDLPPLEGKLGLTRAPASFTFITEKRY